MNKKFFMALLLATGAAMSGSASATEAEGENVVGRAADRVAHPIRQMRNAHPVQRIKNSHPIHRLKHAHPIRRLEGREAL